MSKSSQTSNPSAGQRVRLQLTVALYGATSRMTRLHRPFLEPMGLTYSQFLVMLVLYESEPRTVGEIAQELGMDHGTLTPLLKRITTAGLVTRERDANDDRRVLIGLTEKGEALREGCCAVPEKIRTLCRLTDEGLADLRDTLNELAIPMNASQFDPDGSGDPE